MHARKKKSNAWYKVACPLPVHILHGLISEWLGDYENKLRGSTGVNVPAYGVRGVYTQKS